MEQEVGKMRKAYPVIFTKVDDNILIEVPDLCILTEANEDGKSTDLLSDAIMMARDAIGANVTLAEDEGIEVVKPSDIKDIDITKSTFYRDGEGFISIVDVDITEYRRKHEKKSVRRNVTLPSWLNFEAEKAHLNVSKVLQEALLQKLNISR